MRALFCHPIVFHGAKQCFGNASGSALDLELESGSESVSRSDGKKLKLTWKTKPKEICLVKKVLYRYLKQ
jgi:hypothetical protein